MEKLLLDPPERSAYSVQDGTSFKQVKLEGGASRSRRDKLGTARLADIVWVLKPDEFIYFNSFYDTTIGEGSTPFLIDLAIERSDKLIEYEARFIQDSLRRPAAVNGLNVTIRAQLEVLPAEIQDELNNLIVDAWNNGQRTGLGDITVGNESMPTMNSLIGDQNFPSGDTVNLNVSSSFSGANIIYSATNLPTGLSIDANTGVISGTITDTGSVVTVTVIATNGGGSTQQSFTWTTASITGPP